ncbi:AMP-dependent synthetase/ligase [Aureivirga sp. CE67]|uniref:AMP-dependent synthetase/ligase n=1 Tax=Aureivirga sp. CE67 TaxID=1788983 RepID=UPI0018C992EF|nr:long-chain fatty acid--CoA ligase [Aureivirga sp. CE67]
MNEITRIFDFPYHQLKKHNLSKSLVMKRNHVWSATSTEEYIYQANAISRALIKLGVQPNDKIAVISSTNRTEWNIVDIGILQTGAQNVPIYPTISHHDFEYIFNHAEVKYCFLSDNDLLEKVNEIKDNVPTLEGIYSFEEIEDCKNWTELIELGIQNEDLQPDVEKRKDNVNADDLATIIYTSGTTGTPKGVMLSHKNIVSNVLDSHPRLPFVEGETRVLSFLPVCHIFERMLHYLYQYEGATIYFAEAIDKIADNAKEIKPHFMSVVPRLLEKIFDAITAKGAELPFPKRQIFFWAVSVAEKWVPYQENGALYEYKLKIANKLIFSKWREALGGEISAMVSGSAPLQPRLARIFTAAGLSVMEGYGLTETSPVIAVNMMKDRMFKIGTVGKPIRNVEVKIADDGEILVKGPNVMLGYNKDPKKTAEVLKDGYFHTGDKGEIDSEGFLKITGRKKEIFKTSGGKYVSPALLENEMKQSRFIEQILVVGEGEKMPAAIVQPNFEFVLEWARRHDLDVGSSFEEMANNPKVKERIFQEIDERNHQFGKWEQIKKIELTPTVWTIDNGLLTPTLKPKRNVILDHFKNLYNKLYDK